MRILNRVKIKDVKLMFNKELLKILVCPKCKGELEYVEEPESLSCKRCNRVYEIKDSIPILIPDEESARGKDN